MGLPKLKTKISIEDYLEGEKISQIKHEYEVSDHQMSKMMRLGQMITK